MFFGNECECGFATQFSSQEQRGPVCCQHINESGLRCQLSGTVSFSIPSSTRDYPKFYCGYHMQMTWGSKPDKQKFTDWLLSSDKRLIDSSFDWINYLWRRASGESELELRKPDRKAYDYLAFNNDFDVKGLLVIKETMPRIWELLVSKNPGILKMINKDYAEEGRLHETGVW